MDQMKISLDRNTHQNISKLNRELEKMNKNLERIAGVMEEER